MSTELKMESPGMFTNQLLAWIHLLIKHFTLLSDQYFGFQPERVRWIHVGTRHCSGRYVSICPR